MNWIKDENLDIFDVFLDEDGHVSICGDVNYCLSYSDEDRADVKLKTSIFADKIQAIVDEATEDLIKKGIISEVPERKEVKEDVREFHNRFVESVVRKIGFDETHKILTELRK